jgi:hypothetical protein
MCHYSPYHLQTLPHFPAWETEIMEPVIKEPKRNLPWLASQSKLSRYTNGDLKQRGCCSGSFAHETEKLKKSKPIQE